MEEKHLLLLSLVCSLTGLGVLWVLSGYAEVPLRTVRDIASLSVDAPVRLEGSVKGFFTRGQTSFFQLNDSTGAIPVVVFGAVQVQNGRQVIVEGKVALYKGKREVIAERVEGKDGGA